MCGFGNQRMVGVFSLYISICAASNENDAFVCNACPELVRVHRFRRPRAFVEKKFTSRRVTSPVTRHFFSHAPTRRTPAWTPRHPRSGNDRPAGLPTIRRRGSPPNLLLPPILNGAVAPCHPRLTKPAAGSVASFTASRWERRSRRRSR